MGFGRNSFLGWAEESTWGTPVTPTKYAEIVAESMNAIRRREPRPVVRDLDIREGNTYDALFGAAGSVTIEGNYGGMLKLLEHLFGDSSGTNVQQDVAVRWRTTFLCKDTVKSGKGLSLHVNTDVDNGATPQRRYAGFKINNLKLSFDPTRNLQVEIGGAAKDFAVIAASTPTFPSIARYVAGHQTVVKVDTVARTAALVEIEFDNGLDLEKRILGSKNIDEPIRSDTRRSITGKLTMDALAADLTKYDAGTLFQLDVVATGAVLGTGNWLFNLTALKCEVTDDPYHIKGPGLLMSEIPFRVLKPTSGEILTIAIDNDESTIA